MISFCICTYNRNEGLASLLQSLTDMNLPGDLRAADVRVVVVDNYDGSSEEVLKAWSSRFNWTWFHEPQKGLSNARNRSVSLAKDSEFVVFVDDDQILEKDCLAYLMATQKEFKADLVYGSNPPIFEIEPVKSISHFFENSDVYSGEQILFAPTNCTLVRASVLDSVQGPFDWRFNVTGGEDSFLTRQLSANGYHLVADGRAKAFEYIKADRANLRWIIKRQFRVSTSLTFQDRLLKVDVIFISKRVCKALLKILCGSVFLPFCFVVPGSFKQRWIPLISMVEGFGHLAGYFGIHPKEYDDVRS